MANDMLATALKNIESLGFTFSDRLIQAVRQLSQDQFEALVKQLVVDLELMVGAHVKYKPMYAGFPAQVMEADEAELYLNAILHYLTNILPEQKVSKREPLPLLERVDLKVIDLGSEHHFIGLIRQLIEAKGSISETDKKTLMRCWSKPVPNSCRRYCLTRSRSRKTPDSS